MQKGAGQQIWSAPSIYCKYSNATAIKPVVPYQATHAGCGPAPTPPAKPTPCDRSSDDLAGRGTVSVTAGPLVVGNASVLGEIGDVVILGNSEDHLFYFVCRSAVGFIG